MSKSRLASALVLGTLLAATTLAGLPGVAHAQATDASTGKQAARRPPTEGQVGEPWHPRMHAPTPPAKPNSQPRWPVAPLAMLTAALALAGGLATTRASRRARPRLTA
jgi:hypothetical protein